VKKPGSHFDVTVYRTQSDVLICRREKRHLWYKHPTSDVCMVMGRRRTHVIQTPYQWCLYGDGPDYCRLSRIWTVQVAHSQRKCKSSTSSILHVDRITVCRRVSHHSLEHV
jgi:hypothetical protein